MRLVLTWLKVNGPVCRTYRLLLLISSHFGGTARVSNEQAEVELLIELASGTKTFEQIKTDAQRHGLPTLVHSNPARGITERLAVLTNISKDSLTFRPIRCSPDAATRGNTMQHPFVLISTIVEKCLAQDEYFSKLRMAPHMLIQWHQPS